MGYATRGGFGLPNRELLSALYRTYGNLEFTYSDAQQSIPDFNRRSFMKLVHDGFITPRSARSPKTWEVTNVQNRPQTSAGSALA